MLYIWIYKSVWQKGLKFPKWQKLDVQSNGWKLKKRISIINIKSLKVTVVKFKFIHSMRDPKTVTQLQKKINLIFVVDIELHFSQPLIAF